MYIAKMTHSLDETGNIPKHIPKEAREMASFLALVVDETTKELPSRLTLTDIRCFKKGCEGSIKTEFLIENEEIHWICSKCDNEGVISDWQSTRWDKSGN